MVKRLENWPRRLGEYLEKMQNVPFEWGKNDCALFVGGAVEAVTGEPFNASYAGSYSDEQGAAEVIAKGKGLFGIFTSHLGQAHTNPRLAGRGDVVLMRLPQLTAGVVDASGTKIAAVGPQGMVRLPLSRASFIWSY